MNKEDVKIIFSDRLIKILKKLEPELYVAFELLYMADDHKRLVSNHKNPMRISNIDVGKDFYFHVYFIGHGKNGETTRNSIDFEIESFIKMFFENTFSKSEITDFIHAYNTEKGGYTGSKDRLSISSSNKKIEYKPIDRGVRINLGKFEYKPKDPRSTFLSLTTQTYPHGHEEELLDFLPTLKKDIHDNYYLIVGDGSTTTMFTSHLDTADRKQSPTTLFSKMVDGNEMIHTDGSTILGADDKSGVTIMLYMMAHNIPGLYYFFVGEEVGGIGSHKLASDFVNTSYLKNINKCISFDRRKTGSVITSQMGRACCSNDFGKSLCDEYNKNGLDLSLDNTGVYTDSASFIDDIPECTNISVGYDSEHTVRENQNMTFLIQICEASIKVDWEALKVSRKVGFSREMLAKNGPLFNEIKKASFGVEVKIVGFEDYTYVRIDLDQSDVESVYDALTYIKSLFKKYKTKCDDVIVMDSYIKIEIK